MLASADFKYEFSRVLPRTETQLDLSEVNTIYKSMEEEGVGLLRQIKGLGDGAIKVRRGADMRYFGQVFDMEATMPETAPGKTVTQDDLRSLIENFHERHKEIFGYADSRIPTSITSLKLVARGERPPLKIAEQSAFREDPSEAFKRIRSVFFKESGRFVETSCYDGDKLRHGNTITGPAVIEEKTTTLVIPPKARVNVDRYGNYVGKLL
jgi:N-methylhydantoinase A